MAYDLTYCTDGRVLRGLGDGRIETGFTWQRKGRRVTLYQGFQVFGSYASQGAATRAVNRYLAWAGLPRQELPHE